MSVKIPIFHKEVELRVLLEVIAIHAIFALLLSGIYFLQPTLTGFVTVSKEINYSDSINEEFNQNAEYVWQLGNPGDLKNIKISGEKTKAGSARVYVEKNGTRYLLFDSTQLVEKEEGVFGVTGFAVAGTNETNKTQNKAPVWNSTTETFTIKGKTDINLSDYFVDENNDELTYSSGPVEKLKTKITDEILTLTPNNNAVESKQLTITASDGTNSTQKTISLAINTTPPGKGKNKTINKTPDPASKQISIKLEYGENANYDADNDGAEKIDGVIDFTTKDTNFNWDVNEGNLCTRYEVYSEDQEQSTYTCFGNSNCCSFVDLQSSRESWNESLFLTYGSLGSTASNVVFAQVLHVDYNLSLSDPYNDVLYSKWKNLTAEFQREAIQFEDVCMDTCSVSGFNATSYTLVIEVENATLTIGSIEYVVEEETTNANPQLVKEFENITMPQNSKKTLNLANYFSDEDGDNLTYSYFEMDNITINFENDKATIIPDKGFLGTEFTFITANDSFGRETSNVFRIKVVREAKPKLEIRNSTVMGDNWTVVFNTTGSGDLVINSFGSNYSEMYTNNVSTVDDLEILELRCGSFEHFNKEEFVETNNFRAILKNNSGSRPSDLIGHSVGVRGVVARNYSCKNYSYYTVKLLNNETHSQRVNFSGAVKTVSSAESNVQTVNTSLGTFEVRDKNDERLVVFDSFGNVNVKGKLMEGVQPVADDDDFKVQNSSNGLNMAVTNPEGYLMVKGDVFEKQTNLTFQPNSFIIQNRNGTIVAYVSDEGDLFLKGEVTQNVLFE